MALELSTAGIKVKWCVESSAGTRPTTGYSEIRGVKSIPEYNPEPAQLETTPLSATGYHTYIPGLRDLSGAIGITVNDYADFRSDWTALVSAFNTAKTAGLNTWFEYAIPSHESFYFGADVTGLGFGGAEVDSVLENVAYITPNTEPIWAAAST